jgi:peptidoglycan/xylan/chitin deacetylase (PgdA/CDA1 family)
MKRVLGLLGVLAIVITLFIAFQNRTAGQQTPTVTMDQAAAATDPLPGTKLSVDELKKQFFHVSAGRRLKPKEWPNGARVAIGFGFQLDNASPNLARGNLSLEALSRGEYGAVDGLRRVLRVLDKHNVPATFFFPAISSILHPQMIKDVLAKKRHEIGAHGWIHESAGQLSSEAEERRLLTQAIDYLTKEIGHRPIGYRTPGASYSPYTIPLLKELGFLYEANLMASDDAYELNIDGQPSGLVELPTDWILDDAPYFGRTGALPSPDLIYKTFRDEFDVAYEEGRGLLIFQMHPHISGHRSRIKPFDEYITYVKSKPGVWFATYTEIANYVLKHGNSDVTVDTDVTMPQ